MGVTVCLPLFGPAGRELEEGAALRGQQLRDLAGELQERLLAAADKLDRLAADGWATRVAMYDVIVSARGVQTQEEAIRRLGALGLAPEDFMIVEDVEDEDVGHA